MEESSNISTNNNASANNIAQQQQQETAETPSSSPSTSAQQKASEPPPIKYIPSRKESRSNDGSAPRRRIIPIVTTPHRGLCSASTSSDDDEDDDEDAETNNADGNDLDNSDGINGRIPSVHNSRGDPVCDDASDPSESSTHANANAAAAAAVSADQERQILLLMLLAQVCALHDPTPRTFTVHVLELFERGILGRQSIHFLFELGLVPSTTPRMLENSSSSTTDYGAGTTTKTGIVADAKEEIFDLMTTNISDNNNNNGTPVSPQTLRTREVSAIRSSLEQHDLAHQFQQLAKTGGNNNPYNDVGTNIFGKSKLVTSPTAAAESSAAGTAADSNDGNNNDDDDAAPNNPSSWAVEHHPLSLSRYQREFHQVRLLNAGSFGEVFQSTNKIDLKDYAVKRVAFSAWGYSKDSVTQVIREVHCLAQCDHPNVVRYYTSWLEPSWMTGSGATMMMSNGSSSNGNVRRQQKLLTDIQHMMLTGEDDNNDNGIGVVEESSSEIWGGESTQTYNFQSHSNPFLRSPTSTPSENDNGLNLIRHRKFSIGSSMDDESFHSSVAGGSSYDESSGEEEEACAWTVDECHVTTTQEDSIFFEASIDDGHQVREDSIFLERKEVWEPSSSPPRRQQQQQQQQQQQKKKKQQNKAAAARLKYRYQICLFIQMQLCHPATLGDWIRNRNSNSEDPEQGRPERVNTAAKIFGQIVGGLHHIHKKGIVHRDLKPANLFRSLEDEQVFLIGDFGLSKLIQSATHQKKTKHDPQSTPQTSMRHTDDANQQALVVHPPMASSHFNNTLTTWQDPLTAGVGTASYAAPEQVTTQTYGMMADVFSLGLILLEMICCFTTEHERMQTFYDCRHRRDIPSWIEQDFPIVSKAILDCTDPDPSNRPTAEVLLKVACELSPPEAKPAATASEVEPNETSSDAQNDELRRLTSELQLKSEKLLEYELQLEEKDLTIEQLRRELASLRPNCSTNPGSISQSIQVSAIRSRDSVEINEVASSSSSSDGV